LWSSVKCWSRCLLERPRHTKISMLIGNEWRDFRNRHMSNESQTLCRFLPASSALSALTNCCVQRNDNFQLSFIEDYYKLHQNQRNKDFVSAFMNL
jgi:hypothetical protein